MSVSRVCQNQAICICIPLRKKFSNRTRLLKPFPKLLFNLLLQLRELRSRLALEDLLYVGRNGLVDALTTLGGNLVLRPSKQTKMSFKLMCDKTNNTA